MNATQQQKLADFNLVNRKGKLRPPHLSLRTKPAMIHAMATFSENHLSAHARHLATWMWIGLAVSLLIHGSAIVWMRSTVLEGFSTGEKLQLAPPKVVMRQAKIDPKTLADAAPTKMPELAPKVPLAVAFTAEKPVAGEMKVEPKPIDLSNRVPVEKPAAPAEIGEAMEKIQKTMQSKVDSELAEIAGSLAKNGPVSVNQPSLGLKNALAQATAAAEAAATGGATNKMSTIPGRQTLEQALTSNAAPSEERPIGIPGGALFKHDSSDLGPDSLPVLRQIALLAQKFPDYTLVITGYTDATGTADYNLRLSQRRADAVREWLVRNAKIASVRVESRGRGMEDLVVDAERSVEEQAPNRRVEVMLKPSSKDNSGKPVQPLIRPTVR